MARRARGSNQYSTRYQIAAPSDNQLIQRIIPNLDVLIDQASTSFRARDQLSKYLQYPEVNTDRDQLMRLVQTHYSIARDVVRYPAADAEVLQAALDISARASRRGKPSTSMQVLVARSHQCSPQQLTELAKSRTASVWQAAVSHHNCPDSVVMETLRDRASSTVAESQQFVAANMRCPPDALSRLADSNDPITRQAVAKNPNTLPETLALLINDSSTFVRKAVFAHPNLPEEYKWLDTISH